MVYALAKPEKYTCSVQDVVTQIRSGLVSNHQSFMPEERHIRYQKKRKQKKTVIVEWRSKRSGPFRDWSKFKSYVSIEIAQDVVDKKNGCDSYFEYRIKPSQNS